MKKKPLVLAVVGAAGLLVLGGGGFFAYRTFFSGGGEEPPAEEALKGEAGHSAEAKGGHGEAGAPAAPALSATYRLDPAFVVNLADPGQRRYAKIMVEVELDSPGATAELEAAKARARDTLLMLLSSKTSGEMVTVEGKEVLRTEILRRLNSLLTAGKVVEVYFTEFVVQ